MAETDKKQYTDNAATHWATRERSHMHPKSCFVAHMHGHQIRTIGQQAPQLSIFGHDYRPQLDLIYDSMHAVLHSRINA
jgi:hypothetical protein